MPNFNELLNYYGVETYPGVIVESSGYYLGTYPTYLLPKNGFHESVAKAFSNGLSMIVPFSQGMRELSSVRSTLEIKSLLYTSADAYLKINTQAETTLKEEGDIDGPFQLAYLIEEKVGSRTGRMLRAEKSFSFSSSSPLERRPVNSAV